MRVFNRQSAIILVAGSAHALSIAWPFSFGLGHGQPVWWLQLLAMCLLAWQLDKANTKRQGAWSGWLFATAMQVTTWWWLFISLHIYGGLAAPLAVIAIVGLAAFLALYYAAACALFVALASSDDIVFELKVELLIEVYDAATANRNLGLSSLAARTVLAADDVLIAGFVLGGAGNRLVLIRAAGPTLTEFGLGGVLSDPRIELFGASGKIYENDDWTSEIRSVVARVGAFTLPAGSKDSALLVSLAPGSYSVQVRGPAGVGGVVLVELYDVP